MSQEERRTVIINGALGSFIALGFAGTTTAEVARRAKVSKRAIYEVFQNKMDLFATVIKENRRLFLDLPRPADEMLPTEETLFRIFRLNINEAEALEREAILKLMTRESVLFPELSDYLYESKAIQSREMLIEWLHSEREKQRLFVAEPEMVAGMLMDVVFGALLPRKWIVDAEGQQRCSDAGMRQYQLEIIKNRLRIILRGLKTSHDPSQGCEGYASTVLHCR
ncbi:TetR/AcrR family transcriptional regulator [Erwinia amylovora]